MEGKGVKALLGGKPKDEDVRRTLLVIDELLGKLPADEIERFSKTKEYELYRRVLERYGVK